MKSAALAVAILLGAVAPAFADTDVDFETPSVANCATATNQFAPALTFVSAAPEDIGELSTPTAVTPASGTRSPTHVVQTGACSAEFPFPQVAFQLGQTRAAVSVYVRAVESGFSPPVQLRAYDAGGTRIDTNGSAYTTLVGGAAAYTQISAADSDNTNRIATVALVTQNAATFQGVHIYLDDVHLADGMGGVTPDFTIGPAPVLVLPQGGTGAIDVPVNRVNGSSGAIAYGHSGEPAGLSVAPNAVSSTKVNVSAAASLDTAPGSTSFTLTGTPSSSASGPGPRSTTVPVFVQTTSPSIAIADPAEGTLLDRVPYEPTVSGTFTSPRAGSHVCAVVSPSPAPQPLPASCPTAAGGTSGSWSVPLTGVAPGANYITAFIVDGSGYTASATRLLRVTDESTGVDLRITGVQVTQDVQDTGGGGLAVPRSGGAPATYGGVPLVQGKPVYVRLFADTNRPARSDGRTPDVTALLHVFAGGHELPFSPYLPQPLFRDLAVGGTYATFAELADYNQGYLFAIPATYTTRGPLTLTTEINIGTRPIAECVTCLGDDSLTVQNVGFQAEHTRDIYPMKFHDEVDPTHPHAVTESPDAAFALARQVYPFPLNIHPWVADIDITSDLVAAAADIASHPNDRNENWITHYPGDWDRDHGVNPVIAVADGGYAGMETSSFFCCLPPRIDPFAVTVDFRPLTSVAHEFGHTEGLSHADHQCGGGSDGQVSDGGWPDAFGSLIGIGFDGLGRRALPPFDPSNGMYTNADFMSYCAGDGTAWISTRNWRNLVDHEHARAAPAGTRATPPAGPSGPGLAVSLVMPASGGAGAITNLEPTDGGAQGSDPQGTTQLIVSGAGGSATSTTSVTPVAVHADTPGAIPELQVNAVVPAGADAHALSVVRDGTLVATRTASAHAPTVRLLSPRRGTKVTSALNLRWSAADADGDRLSFAIDEAAGPRAPFKLLTAGLTGTHAKIPLAMLAPAAGARIRIRALDGFNQGTSIVTGITIPVAAPQIEIFSPAKAVKVGADGVLALSGQAYDAKSKALRGHALVWRLDGRRVATGNEAAIGELAPGRHVLTLTATAGGKSGAASRRVTVGTATPRLLVAPAPATIPATARSVPLTLATSVPATITIRGGRATRTIKTDRTPVKLSLAIRPGHAPLKLRLRVRGGGTTANLVAMVARG